MISDCKICLAFSLIAYIIVIFLPCHGGGGVVVGGGGVPSIGTGI